MILEAELVEQQQAIARAVELARHYVLKGAVGKEQRNKILADAGVNLEWFQNKIQYYLARKKLIDGKAKQADIDREYQAIRKNQIDRKKEFEKLLAEFQEKDHADELRLRELSNLSYQNQAAEGKLHALDLEDPRLPEYQETHRLCGELNQQERDLIPAINRLSEGIPALRENRSGVDNKDQIKIFETELTVYKNKLAGIREKLKLAEKRRAAIIAKVMEV